MVAVGGKDLALAAFHEDGLTHISSVCREEHDLDLLRRGAAVLGYMASNSQRCQREMAKRRGVYSAIARVQKLIVKAAGDNAAAPEYMQQLMEKLCPGLSKLISKMKPSG